MSINKKFYFLCGLPRSGNTLLGSILNQNLKIKITANTILTDILYQLSLIKTYEIYKNFPDEKSFNNISKNVFNNYYKNWNTNYIITRGPWGTVENLYILKSIIKKPKFLILYRPVLECLASFIKIEKPINIEERCKQLMDKNGMIGKNLLSIKNILKTEEYILIKYWDLVKNPCNEINKIYKFFNISYFKHFYKKINQFSVNNITYDDSILNAPLHTIKTNKIYNKKINLKKILSKNIINKYSNLDI
jgi:sulfotransferase